jgi:hypothetical protein
MAIIFGCLALLLSGASAFTPSAHSFTIVGVAGSGVESLPFSYANSFSFWNLDLNGVLSPYQSTSSTQIRPTLDVLLKGGIPSYVMAGLDVGTRSKLLAQQWTTFSNAVEPNFRLILYQGRADGTDTQLLHVTSGEIRQSIEALGMAMSSMPVEMEQGFHILSISFWDGQTVHIDDVPKGASLTCILTAEPDARELFILDPGLLEMTATSYLLVDASFSKTDEL